MTYYLLLGGKVRGPYTVEQIQRGLDSGKISTSVQARPNNSSDDAWASIGEIVPLRKMPQGATHAAVQSSEPLKRQPAAPRRLLALQIGSHCLAIAVGFVVGALFFRATGMAVTRIEPQAVSNKPRGNPPGNDKQKKVVELSASAAPNDNTTREAAALRLLHSGTFKDWAHASADIRFLAHIYFVARFTSKDDQVLTFARAATIGDYLNKLYTEGELSFDDTPIAEMLSWWQAMHDTSNEFEPRSKPK